METVNPSDQTKASLKARREALQKNGGNFAVAFDQALNDLLYVISGHPRSTTEAMARVRESVVATCETFGIAPRGQA